jgi:hypothetical protein
MKTGRQETFEGPQGFGGPSGTRRLARKPPRRGATRDPRKPVVSRRRSERPKTGVSSKGPLDATPKTGPKPASQTTQTTPKAGRQEPTRDPRKRAIQGASGHPKTGPKLARNRPRRPRKTKAGRQETSERAKTGASGHPKNWPETGLPDTPEDPKSRVVSGARPRGRKRVLQGAFGDPKNRPTGPKPARNRPEIQTTRPQKRCRQESENGSLPERTKTGLWGRQKTPSDVQNVGVPGPAGRAESTTVVPRNCRPGGTRETPPDTRKWTDPESWLAPLRAKVGPKIVWTGRSGRWSGRRQSGAVQRPWNQGSHERVRDSQGLEGQAHCRPRCPAPRGRPLNARASG